jgi:hypothetical protein
VRFAVFLYSRKLIVIRAGSTEPREPVNEARTPRVLRGFSPHLVADDDIINGCCGRIVRDRGPLDSSARNASAPRATLHRHLLFSCYIALRARAFRAAMRSYPLLPPRTGRHDVGEVRGGMTLRTSASRRSADIAVKNLRSIGSAVLLLNFQEVGGIHLCSTGVTV